MNELLDLIKNDPRLKGIKITDENLIALVHFLDELDNCEKCAGLSDCKNPFKGKTPFLKAGVVTYKECQYALENKELSLVDSELAESYLKDASFADFRADTDTRKKVLNYAKRFVNKEEEKGLFVYGEYAVGKTYFLCAIANELSKRGISSIIVFVPDLSRFLKSKMSDNSLELYVEKMKRTEVLFLDDLGGEMASAWFRDEILLPILQYRLSHNKPIFISSNHDYNGLSMQYKAVDNSVVKADRLIERLSQMTKRVKL